MASNLVQGAVFTVMVVRAGMLRDPVFEAQLAEQIGRSPRFFLNAPVVLDLRDAAAFATAAEFADAKTVLRRHTLTLVGIQNALPAQIEAAAAAGLASFAPNSTGPRRQRPAEAVPAAASPPEPDPRSEPSPSRSPPPAPTPPLRPEPRAGAGKTRLVTQPVRSGTQIYARGADLIVTAAVSPGAELMADGNIHVYGPLRGRALAGAAGDIEARIFCSRFEAELVSIAGHYLVSEQIPPGERGLPVEIALVDDRLTITRN
ncbi:MAG TPA: septum site-determining protein MinC [Stellaceae bacterium]|nr:septum site-determining protein MinC [Stellaceae bacterium]